MRRRGRVVGDGERDELAGVAVAGEVAQQHVLAGREVDREVDAASIADAVAAVAFAPAWCM